MGQQKQQSAQYTPGPLCERCMAILEASEITAKPPTAVGFVGLLDVDGGWLFRVHKNIHPDDLMTMLKMHRQRFGDGMRAGRDGAFAALRSFIGVDAAIDRATGSN